MPPLAKEKQYKFKEPVLEDATKVGSVVPKKKGNIPRLAVMLGLIEAKFYEIYLSCSGEKNVTQLSEEFRISVPDLAITVDKLLRNGLVTI